MHVAQYEHEEKEGKCVCVRVCVYAAGPAIVITTMHEVSKQRLRVAKGIPSIIVCAASFDDMVRNVTFHVCRHP